MIKTIIFDNNGVLTTRDKDATYRDVAAFLGVNVTTLKRIWDKLAVPLDEGKITNKEFLESVLVKLDKVADVDKLMNIYLNSYQKHDDVQNFVKTLKHHYELAMLTNFGEAFHRCQRRWGLNEIFEQDRIFLSADLHMKKPNEAIFRYVLEKLKRQPAETIFIDDRLINIETAKKIGMETILFINFDQFKNDLDRILGRVYMR